MLKSGGRVALAVWGDPAENPWLEIPNRVLQEHGLAKAPATAEDPGAFALADEERLRRFLEEAGFGEIEIETLALERRAPSFEEWWETQLDMSPAGPAVRAAPPKVARAVAAEVEARLTPYASGDGLAVPGTNHVARAGA